MECELQKIWRDAVRDDTFSFKDLDHQSQLNFLKELLDEGTPNVPWIALEHAEMLQAVFEDRDEVEGPDGEFISPRLHLTLHGIVERQYGSGEPPIVQETVDRLLAADWKRHDAMHIICTANVEEIMLILRDEESFNEERFSVRVRNLADRAMPAKRAWHPPARDRGRPTPARRSARSG
jgi:hypothetical protein